MKLRMIAPVKTLWITSTMILLGGIFTINASYPASAAEKDGKAVFAGEKCQECHSIKALGIKKEASEETKDIDSPDLSSVGVKRNAEWISRWLMKQETIDGKKHEKKFKGNAQDLKAVSEWLAAQKGAKK